LYREKEISFPVAVGMTNFMAESRSGERYNREGLAAGPTTAYSHLEIEDLKARPRGEIESMLQESSRNYFVGGERLNRVDEFLERAYPEINGHGGNGQGGEGGGGQSDVLRELAGWANQEFKVQLQPEEILTLSPDGVRQKVLSAYDTRYRPELCQAERALILEILDTAWKDHLYYMDHLRSGIGLVGYAQKDPKVEYKREGQKAFAQVWDRIGQQVTSAIFRLEKESPGFVGSLWQITATTHEDASVAADEYMEQSGGVEPGQTSKAVEPIHNLQPKVGRNDPCPCGSGKKYKKCHGAN
jgi:preprotein translocase subunit SecA